MPSQVTRWLVVFALLLTALFLARRFLIPTTFGKYGHYRASAVDDNMAQEMQYAGQSACGECHEEVLAEKSKSKHGDVVCEVCHGPALNHTLSPEEILPPKPDKRGLCPLCHGYLASRPTGFPQIIVESHNPGKPCMSCHEPHQPKTPTVPAECSACHAMIAKTKAVSHHASLSCDTCHKATEDHKVDPPSSIPTKPSSSDFCGGCHDINAQSPKEIPRIDLTTHNERYLCWQCHYPHYPEGGE